MGVFETASGDASGDRDGSAAGGDASSADGSGASGIGGFAAGAGDRIVGTVSYSDYPEAAKGLPRVGDIRGLDLERLLAIARTAPAAAMPKAPLPARPPADVVIAIARVWPELWRIGPLHTLRPSQQG